MFFIVDIYDALCQYVCMTNQLAALTCLLSLTACNAEIPAMNTGTAQTSATVASTDTQAIATKGDKGDPGIMGPVGPQGLAGAQGIQGGVIAFHLHDINGTRLPGTLIGSGLLYDEVEKTTAAYACAIDGTCGMTSILAYFQDIACKGNPLVMPTETDRVFAIKGNRWIAHTDTLVTNVTVKAWTTTGSDCISSMSSGKSFYVAAPYNGDFPAAPKGPYTIVRE